MDDELTKKDLLKYFEHINKDLSNIEDEIGCVFTGEYIFSDDDNPIVATTFTASCTNVLVYNSKFSFLMHLNPSQFVGKNNNTDLDKFISIMKEKIEKEHYCDEDRDLNILISFGASKSDETDYTFHNIDNICNKIKDLMFYCSKKNIYVNVLDTEISKHLLYDYRNGKIILESLNEKGIYNLNDDFDTIKIK